VPIQGEVVETLPVVETELKQPTPVVKKAFWRFLLIKVKSKVNKEEMKDVEFHLVFLVFKCGEIYCLMMI